MPAAMDSVDGILVVASSILVAVALHAIGASGKAIGLILFAVWPVALALRRRVAPMPTIYAGSRAANLAVAILTIFGSLVAAFGLFTTWVNWDVGTQRLTEVMAVLAVGLGMILVASMIDLWRRRRARAP